MFEALEARNLLSAYKIYDLSADGWFQANALNEAGQVAGIKAAGEPWLHAEPPRAAIWTAGGGFQDLGTLGGGYSAAWSINSSGAVVGAAEPADGEIRSFLWTPEQGMQDLGLLGLGGWSTYSFAKWIMDDGRVIGYAANSGGQDYTLFSEGKWSALFDEPQSAQERYVYAVTAKGNVLVSGGDTDGQLPVFRAEVGNDLGQTPESDGLNLSVTYPDGIVQIFHAPGNLPLGAAAMNNCGVIGGTFWTGRDEDAVAFITDGKVVRRLDELIPAGSGWELTDVIAVNDSGMIIGSGLKDGVVHTFAMVPETGVEPPPHESFGQRIDLRGQDAFSFAFGVDDPAYGETSGDEDEECDQDDEECPDSGSADEAMSDEEDEDAAEDDADDEEGPDAYQGHMLMAQVQSAEPVSWSSTSIEASFATEDSLATALGRNFDSVLS